MGVSIPHLRKLGFLTVFWNFINKYIRYIQYIMIMLNILNMIIKILNILKYNMLICFIYEIYYWIYQQLYFICSLCEHISYFQTEISKIFKKHIKYVKKYFLNCCLNMLKISVQHIQIITYQFDMLKKKKYIQHIIYPRKVLKKYCNEYVQHITYDKCIHMLNIL